MRDNPVFIRNKPLLTNSCHFCLHNQSCVKNSRNQFLWIVVSEQLNFILFDFRQRSHIRKKNVKV
uniref:Uncharacterized protein n=1 Tax=Erwinia amylovora ATCC BAA-2158 TaxID=889211 RepID=E5BAN5_ERWAM|nr:hypothetical protein predicted by Glimmer/Critica [Erwinia amylovora ATCC BAA-2158]